MSRPTKVTPEKVDQAKAALKVFRGMQPTLTAYARMLTGRPNVKVVAAAHDNGSTDGKNIYYRPPIALGVPAVHRRSKCDKRDERGLQKCEACATRESVLSTVYHEIAHIWFNSFAPTTEEDRLSLLHEAIDECKGKYGASVRLRVAAAPEVVKSQYMGLANLISPFLPTLVNALEDARVNRELFRALPGTVPMFGASITKVFTEGVEQQDPETGEWTKISWKDYKPNQQIMTGVFCKASGYDYAEWFSPRVVHDLNDKKLGELVARCDVVSAMSEVYRLSFLVLARLRELGYCRLPDDIESDESDKDAEEAKEADKPEESKKDEESDDNDPGKSDSPEADSGNEPGEEDDRGTSGEGESSSESSDGADEESDDEGAGSEPPSEDPDSGSGSAGTGDDEVPGESEPGSNRDKADPAPSPERDSEGSEADSPEEVENESAPGREGSDKESSGPVEDEASGADLDSPGDESETLETSDSPSAGAEDSGSSAMEDDLPDHGDGDSRGPGDLESNDGESPEGGTDSGTDDRSLGGPRGRDLETSHESVEEVEDDELVDTGKFDRGTRVIEIDDAGESESMPEPEPELEPHPEDMGSPEEAKIGVLKLGDHEEAPTSVGAHSHHHDETDDTRAMDMVILQSVYFEMPSANVAGVKVYRFPEELYGSNPKPTRGLEVGDGWSYDQWAPHRSSFRSLGIHGDFSPPESVIQPALLQARIAFADNARADYRPNLKSGRVNGRILGKRAPVGDPRLMRKKSRPGKKSFFVLVGIDISGSSMGTNIDLAKRVAMAEAELCQRMGLKFAVYAHSGNAAVGIAGRAYNLEIYEVKSVDEPWNDRTRERLSKLGPDNANLDGHTLEFYRKILDTRPEQTKILHYYTDGAMPCENFEEELEILQREIKTCNRKGYTVLGVGIRTDAPKQHGLETVEVNEQADILKVIKHLEKRLVN